MGGERLPHQLVRNLTLRLTDFHGAVVVEDTCTVRVAVNLRMPAPTVSIKQLLGRAIPRSVLLQPRLGTEKEKLGGNLFYLQPLKDPVGEGAVAAVWLAADRPGPATRHIAISRFPRPS